MEGNLTTVMSWQPNFSGTKIEQLIGPTHLGLYRVSFTNFLLVNRVISTQYFDENQFLWKDAISEIDSQASDVEDLVGLFNSADGLHNGVQKIDLEELKQKVDGQIAECVTYHVNWARAEALYFMGEQKAALTEMEKNIDHGQKKSN
jgi:hypothetical protein